MKAMHPLLHVLTFAVLGPMLGTVIILMVWFFPYIEQKRDIFFVGLLIMPAAHSVGSIPAILTGILDYQLKKRSARYGMLKSFLVGGTTSLLGFVAVLYPFPKRTDGIAVFLVAAISVALAGAIAAMACHLLVRCFGRPMTSN